MHLEARALEPLHRIPFGFDRLGLRVAQRQAEQCQTLGLALAAPPVDLEAIGPPGSQDVAAHIVARLGEESAVCLRLALGEREPITPLCRWAIDAEASQQH